MPNLTANDPLVREIPEAMKPRRIEIGIGEPKPVMQNNERQPVEYKERIRAA